MGLHINGLNVAGMKFNGQNVVEAKYNGSVVWPEQPPYDDRLRFVAEQARSTISMKKYPYFDLIIPILEYSLDNGLTWTEFSCDKAPTIELKNIGDTVWFRGDNDSFGNRDAWMYFTMTGRISAHGSIEYLRRKDGTVTKLAEYCYTHLFTGCSGLVSSPDLPATELNIGCYAGMFEECYHLEIPPALPATILKERCYGGMFWKCTAMKTPPALPATTLSRSCYEIMFYQSGILVPPELPATSLAIMCYESMFESCHDLTTPPLLPATDLAVGCYAKMFANSGLLTAPALPASTLVSDFSGMGCYERMFEGCSHLVETPELPATTLAEGCYTYMFQGCTSLTTAPELPATLLAGSCYKGMFADCINIIKAPSIPATVLESQCYASMFAGCTSLKWIEVPFDLWNGLLSTYNWVQGVSSTGTFICPEGLPQTFDTSHIPIGWTVETF